MKKFSMKKTTAAAVAATVGAVLLLGGAGTLAYWSDSDSSSAQIISSGTLDVSPTLGNDWKYVSATGVVGAAVDQIVPGDKVQTTINVPVKLVGKNLKAKLEVTRTNTEALDGAIVTTKVGDTVGAADALVVTSQQLTTPTTTPATPVTVPVVVTVSFPDTIAGKTGMSNPDATVSVKSLRFSLAYVLTQSA